MEIPPAMGETNADDGSAWDWGSLLDFTIDDDGGVFPIDPDDEPLLLSWASSDDAQTPTPPPRPAAAEPPPPSLPPLHPPTIDFPAAAPAPAKEELGRVRKRDPRLVCPNYLAGRVPCECPELDEMAERVEEEEEEEEEEQEARGFVGAKKRSRTVGAAASVVRCQVPECEVDISELKGYHKRHRVCLRCANASSVLLDGEQKRYCQQCGKFHLLLDFDEGKRSCRRKLERHNKRRRRRPTDSRSIAEKDMETQEDLIPDVNCDEETKKESEFAADTVKTAVSRKVLDEDILLGYEDVHGSVSGGSQPSHGNQSNSNVSFAASTEAQIDERTTNSGAAVSSTLCKNKNAYSAVCPTGRISFKLYDWNPAEFPRRLRHQIFQWLANMPVELEGYIRPGCTILTVFIAMPQLMWNKLSQDVAVYLKDLINAPDSLLLGRGTILIYLNNTIVQVLKDGTSLMNVKMEVQTPKLHYVYPVYFEAGKSIEFVACGSNLKKPNFRFLVSFAGKYLKYDATQVLYPTTTSYCDGRTADFTEDSEHEMFNIKVSQPDLGSFGPAFVEVENVSGISNFIPVLIANKQICSELVSIEEALCSSGIASGIIPQIAATSPGPGSCEILMQKQTAMSALLLDIAWLLKEPNFELKEAFLSSVNIRRLNLLLKLLTENKSINILGVVVHHLETIIGADDFVKREHSASVVELALFYEYAKHAREIINEKIQDCATSEVGARNSKHGTLLPQSTSEDDVLMVNHHTEGIMGMDNSCSTSPQEVKDDMSAALVTGSTIQRQRCYPHLGIKTSLDSILSANVLRTHTSLIVMVSIVMCLAACVVLLHPKRAGEFVVSVRRCMYNDASKS